MFSWRNFPLIAYRIEHETSKSVEKNLLQLRKIGTEYALAVEGAVGIVVYFGKYKSISIYICILKKNQKY